MYILDQAASTLWNKSTLEAYDLNEDALELLGDLLSKVQADWSPAHVEFAQTLADLGIFLNTVEPLGHETRSLRTPIVHILQNCNSPCVMCDCWMTKGRNHMSPVVASRLFNELANAGATSVMISGGEPTLHPQLESILRSARSAALTVELNTNAIQLTRHAFLSEFGLEALVVSMDGVEADAYNLIRGTNKFDRVCSNVQKFKQQSPGTTVGFRVTLSRYSLLHLAELRTLAEQLGVDVISFNPLDVYSTSFSREMSPARSDALRRMLMPSADELRQALRELTDPRSTIYQVITNTSGSTSLAWGVEDFIRCVVYYITQVTTATEEELAHFPDLMTEFPCNFPTSSLVVGYEQEIRPCFYGPTVASADDFDGARWSPVQMRAKMETTGGCKGCRGKVFCG